MRNKNSSTDIEHKSNNENRSSITEKTLLQKILFGLGVLLILAAAGLFIYTQYSGYRTDEKGQKAVSVLREQIAEHGTENTDYLLVPEKEMPVMEVDGIKYCGILEIPSLQCVQPVREDWDSSLPDLLARYSGTVYQPDFRIGTPDGSLLLNVFQKAAVNEDLRFTDLDGNVFEYKIMDSFTIFDYQFEQFDERAFDLCVMIPFEDQWQILLCVKNQ